MTASNVLISTAGDIKFFFIYTNGKGASWELKHCLSTSLSTPPPLLSLHLLLMKFPFPFKERGQYFHEWATVSQKYK